MSSDMINMESGVSAFTGKGFVTLRWGKESGQLTPEEAEQHGLAIIATAMAARHDAAVFSELTDKANLNLPKDVAARFIGSLRKRMGRSNVSD